MKEIAITLIFITLISCNNTKLNTHTKIKDYIDNNCDKTDSCYINLSDLLDFSWDTMYIISSGVQEDDLLKINKSIPITNQDFVDKILFTLNGKVVLYEEYPVQNVEHAVKNEIVFGKKNNYESFEYNDAKFLVTKEKRSTGDFYLLKHR